MTDKQRKQLERIHNRRTMYECAGRLPDGRLVLLMYCRKSFTGMRDALLDRWDEYIKAHWPKGIMVDSKAWRIGADAIEAGGAALTGRTQRDAILEGELPFVGDLAI